MKQSKQRIIKTKAGELGHIDSHYLAKGSIARDSHRYYLVALMDTATRLTWVEVTEDITALTVMFASLKALNILTMEYDIRFQEILSDNGPEFGQKTSKSIRLNTCLWKWESHTDKSNHIVLKPMERWSASGRPSKRMY